MSADTRAIVEGLVLEVVLASLAGAMLWSGTDAMFWVWFAVSVPAPAWVAIRTPGSMSRISPAEYVGPGLFLAVPVMVGMVIALLLIGLLVNPCEPPPKDPFTMQEGPNICGRWIPFYGGFAIIFAVLPIFPVTTTIVGVTCDLIGWRDRA